MKTFLPSDVGANEPKALYPTIILSLSVEYDDELSVTSFTSVPY